MALNYVNLILDLYDGAGNLIMLGNAKLAPSAQLTDTTDQMIVTPAPVTVQFGATAPGASPQVRLLATDNANLSPAGWGWTISFTGVPGSPASFNFFLPFSGGATQHLSAIAPVASVTTMQAYMPLPNGAATAGYVPIATGNGEASNWGSPGSASLPLTTLGDLLYENATPTAARLPGNTTANKQFLTQTGTGTISAAPVWAAIQATDVPILNQNTTGTAANLAGGATLPAYLAPKAITLTDAAIVNINAALGNYYELLTTSGVGASRTIAAPTNPVAGDTFVIAVQQAASGGPYTVTWASGAGGYSFGTDGAPTLSTAASVVDEIGFRYSGQLGKWVCQGWKLGFS